MAAALPLAVRLLLDAQDEFVRTLDHIPNPGRGGRWGRLNAAGWVAAHLAFSHDTWINVLCFGGANTPWVADWNARQREATLSNPIAPPFEESRDAFLEVANLATGFLESCDATAIEATVETPRGPVKRGYLIARASAHAFVHMGELSVTASLAGAGDAGLPGRLPRAGEVHDEHDPGGTPPLLARLLLDGYDEVARVAPVLSAPARFGAFDRLNPGSFTLAHIGEREDRIWNAGAQGLPLDAWLANAHVAGGDPRSVPDFDEAIAAVMRVRATVTAYLEGLCAEDLVHPIGDAHTIGAELARSAAHCFAHAGELMAVASLFGADDLGQPGMLAHVAATGAA